MEPALVLLACFDMNTAVLEVSVCPVMAKDAVVAFSACHLMVTEVVPKLSEPLSLLTVLCACPDRTTEVIAVLSIILLWCFLAPPSWSTCSTVVVVHLL